MAEDFGVQINYPGSWHDSKLAGISGLYWPRLSDEETPPGYAILGDSAFTTHPNVTNAKILRCRKINEAGQASKSLEMAAVDCVLQSLYPAYRQSGEWGVNALKAPFRRLTTVLPADSYKRYRIIALCCYLMNYRTRTIGHNQIRKCPRDAERSTDSDGDYDRVSDEISEKRPVKGRNIDRGHRDSQVEYDRHTESGLRSTKGDEEPKHEADGLHDSERDRKVEPARS
ncbi:hypothetical protein BWQ96_00638 [Gracilariopsis chorda]|uniref:DDE Tnp4 domain-containing protein n=1 Tax=Gracilariopsis chorda TaxID=448386 RepID=A0A2V3IKJ2_9FLOR|nr:hypothetical protein BWQ96_07652 [Gracilariopsis chorda]PXF49568.1 hypothetical protein BWQ96_00638 [Gracilariopsis chorda]|eukprot:PXF42602.1 hypothetical protein BWQ96_07652 [Gracilariopsis chorda]